ncbi:importin-4-like [Sinocyclocheilus grahami]|uniref:importin-4-like n=1 Tax=Sinocyclocheilus grahami TaxID=75366 RepID=UPI0007ACF50D|nr:PREDICTED: importin-4-like [Sinocyclocheilus grahami]
MILKSYERKGGLMCMAVLAEGCADHIRTKMLSSMLQTVCRSLSDKNQVVRSAALFALGQFSEHLQPDISKFHAELRSLLHGYLSSVNQTKIVHMTKAFYALENFLENLGQEIEPYLPTLMETMLSALNNAENLKLKELAVSAIGAIANAAKEMLVPYFPPIIESLKGFLTDTREEMRALQTQALDTLSVLARTVGKEMFSPLAAECVQLGLNLTDAVDDPDLRRCTYILFSAVSDVSPDCLDPQLTPITTVMLLSLRSTEGVTAHLEEDKQFVLLDEDDADDEGGEGDAVFDEEGETEVDDRDVAGFSVENACIDEKEDALGEIAFNTGVAFQPFLESSFQQVYELRDFPHEDVRRAAFGAMGQFCRAQHKVWKENPTEANHQALHKLLQVVLPCFLEAVRQDRERQVVMAILESMNAVIKSCQGEALQAPGILAEISNTIKDVLKKKVVLPCFLEAVRQDRERQVVMAILESMNAVIKSCQGEALQAPGILAEISNTIKDVLKKKFAGVYQLEQTFPGKFTLVFPALVARLPLKEDMEENKTIYSCLTFLYSHNPLLVVSHLRPIISAAAAHLLGVKDVDNETRNTLLMLLRGLAQHHTQEFESAVISLPDEQRNKMTMAVTQS